MGKIRIGIVGYGNIGRGVEQSIKRNDDMELKAVFTRRDPASVKIQTEGAEVKHFDDMEAMKDDIDVMILCGGSATDLPVIGPKVAASFNTIDSFDTHAKIPEYFANVDKAAKEGKNVSIISVGWDPGMFSLNRLYAESILVQGSTYTFWGKGVSQGHSDAVRRIKGVKDAKQYTIPPECVVVSICKDRICIHTVQRKHSWIPAYGNDSYMSTLCCCLINICKMLRDFLMCIKAVHNIEIFYILRCLKHFLHR